MTIRNPKRIQVTEAEYHNYPNFTYTSTGEYTDKKTAKYMAYSDIFRAIMKDGYINLGFNRNDRIDI